MTLSKTITLYHISRIEEGQPEIQQFVPRIPKQRAPKEDDLIPRICTADSIEGCLAAHPNAVTSIQFESGLDLLEETGNAGLLFRVYHFTAKKEDVLSPEQLAKRGLVPDAEETNEYWFLTAQQPDKVSHIFVPTQFVIAGFSQLSYETLGAFGSWGNVSRYVSKIKFAF